jgi:flagellar biogenesis protein FliO
MNLIEQWQFGYMALLIPAVLVVLYLVMRLIKGSNQGVRVLDLGF